MARLQPGRKAIASRIEIENLRVLSRSDLAVLAEARPPNSLQNLRDNHHRIARAIASGMSGSEVAMTCGVSINRLTNLRSDPAMVELVAHYRSLITAEWLASADPVIDFMHSNALKAQALLSDKLDAFANRAAMAEDPNDPKIYGPTSDLIKIAEFGHDRTGYGKVNRNVNVNVDFAADLEAARNRSAKAATLRQAKVIEAVPPPRSAPVVEQPPLPPRPVPPNSFRRM